jgi:hypothetical protein
VAGAALVAHRRQPGLGPTPTRCSAGSPPWPPGLPPVSSRPPRCGSSRWRRT